MAGRTPCEFSLIRYVPDAVKNEFVNIGVVLRGQGEQPGVEVRFTRDWSRVRCFDPDADTAMLEALESEMLERLGAGGAPAESMRRAMEESFSNAVQVTEPKACLAESLPMQMDQLMQLYVEKQRRRRETQRTGRQAVLGKLRAAFERAGVWELMGKRIAASRYTRPGDPLRIDCGYRPNGTIRMFHAVSLDADTEGAKSLAWSTPEMEAGVARVEKAILEMTAIVEPLREAAEDEEQVAQYRFGVETMERQRIRVLTTTDLPRVAETARRELHV